MELTYLVRGGDGNEYGPATREQLAGWIREGRLSGQQQVKRSDMQDWAVASAFIEFQNLFQAREMPVGALPAVPQAASSSVQVSPGAVIQMKSGASWFYWIAGLSLINSIASLSGSTFGFALGLGITQVFDLIASGSGAAGKGIVLVLDVLASGLFIMFGVFAHKAHTWAFVLGMVLFALDTALVVYFQAWFSVALHVVALFFLFRGMQACRAIRGAAAVN
jgi:hypothetical protein